MGMGGAFVAVAADATATWWNPAGLATMSGSQVTVEYTQKDKDNIATQIQLIKSMGLNGLRLEGDDTAISAAARVARA